MSASEPCSPRARAGTSTAKSARNKKLARSQQSDLSQALTSLGKPRRFHLALRNIDFCDDWALCVMCVVRSCFGSIPHPLHTPWDSNWNQGNICLGTKIEVAGTSVRRRQAPQTPWRVGECETAMPSRHQLHFMSRFLAVIGQGNMHAIFAV